MSWDHNNIEVLGEDELEFVFDMFEVTHVISLFRESGLDTLKEIIPENARWHVETFQDIEIDELQYDDGTLHPATKQEIQNIFDFVDEDCDSSSKIVVHCSAGVGRSPAVALGLFLKSGLTEMQALGTLLLKRYNCWPNDLVVKHIDDILGTNMLDVLNDWKDNVRETEDGEISLESVYENFKKFRNDRQS